ncbi:MAG: hypothetical protein AAF611_22825 [Bacteroidota bacterium]
MMAFRYIYRMLTTLIIILIVVIGYLIFRLPDFFPNTFTHNNPYDDSDTPDGGMFF